MRLQKLRHLGHQAIRSLLKVQKNLLRHTLKCVPLLDLGLNPASHHA
jgi:hypothetical protein